VGLGSNPKNKKKEKSPLTKNGEGWSASRVKGKRKKRRQRGVLGYKYTFLILPQGGRRKTREASKS